MRYRLRTLLIVLALGPPVLATVWWAWPKAVEPDTQHTFDELIDLITATFQPDPWDDIGGPGSIDEFPMRCFMLTETFEENPCGPDPCGCNTLFRPYSEPDDDGME